MDSFGIFTRRGHRHIILCMEAPKPETLPTEPGIYLFKDSSGRILYVGKAKNLRKRLASYFVSPDRLTPKTRVMLGLAASVDTLSTSTEKEALLLEASLIKKHRPRYNIVLRDDKQYVLFKLDKAHAWPRLVLARRVNRDGALYYGPFTSALAAREALKAIHRVFPLRRCKDQVFANRTRPCLYHFMGRCPAPCVLPVPGEEYQKMVKGVELLLSGRSGELTRQLKAEMEAAAESLDFEAAAVLRDQIKAVEQTLERQATVLPGKEDMDVAGFAETETGLALGLLFVRQGSLLDKKTFFWPHLGLEDAGEALQGFLIQYYGPTRFIPPKILLPWAVEDPEAVNEALAEMRGGGVRLMTPRGDLDKRLVSLASQNARQDAANRDNPPILPKIQSRLNLPREPERIEVVDISHISGHKPVAGQVVFVDGRPCKQDYRLYNMEELEGASDDYAALAAYAGRRLKSGPPWPDLLLIDGGRGQLAAVHRAMDQAGQAGLFPLAAISKARESGRTVRRHGDVADQVYLPGRKNPLELKPGSPELLFLQNLRDAAHRFVLSRHRQSRKKAALSGELLRLPGVGPKTAGILWNHFPSLEAMTRASPEDLAALPGLGKKKAQAIYKELQRLRRS